MRDGVVVGADARFQFPINFAEDGLAIHGTGVADNWSVVEHTDASLALKYTWTNGQNHYHFEAQLLASINHKTINVELRLRNLGTHALPMGLTKTANMQVFMYPPLYIHSIVAIRDMACIMLSSIRIMEKWIRWNRLN